MKFLERVKIENKNKQINKFIQMLKQQKIKDFLEIIKRNRIENRKQNKTKDSISVTQLQIHPETYIMGRNLNIN